MDNQINENSFEIFVVRLIEYELNQMKSFIKVIKQVLSDYQEKIENGPDISNEEYLNNDKKRDEFNAWYDEFSSIEGDFATRLYSSFIVSWYSFYEDSLKRLSRDLGLIEKSEDEKIFTSTNELIGLLEDEKDLQIDRVLMHEIELIKEIRNMITHNGGKFAFSVELSDSKKKAVKVTFDDGPKYVYIKKEMFNYLQSHEILHFYRTFFIKPTPEFCDHLIDVARLFFNDLFCQLDWKQVLA